MDYCNNAEYLPCPDLINFEVRYEVQSRFQVYRMCGQGAAACAVLNFKAKTCTIHITQKNLRYEEVVMHELNHCKGWSHISDRLTEYGRPWVPVWEADNV